MFDIRQTLSWLKYMTDENWLVVDLASSPKPIRALIRRLPFSPFSIMKVQRYSGSLDETKLCLIKKKHHVFYSCLEPNPDGVVPTGYRPGSSPYLPTKTLIIDLRKSEDQIFSAMSKTAKNILRKDLPIKIVTPDPDTFYDYWRRSSKTWIISKKSFKHLLAAFGPGAKLLASEASGVLVSGLLLLYSDDTANHYISWTSVTGRHLQAHYHLVWHSIKLAQKDKLNYYDFEGIFDPRFPQNRWLGFSEFKQKFGGVEFLWPACVSKWF